MPKIRNLRSLPTIELCDAWRLALVLSATVLGERIGHFPHANQEVYVIEFLGLVAASMGCALWPWLFGLEISLGIAWYLVVRTESRSWLARLVVDLNRGLGHFEATGPYILMALLLDVPLWLRLFVLSSLVAWGPRALDVAVAQVYRRRKNKEPTPAWIAGARRLPMYGFAVSGFCFLLLLAPEQWRAILPSTIAVLGGMGLRLSATWLGHRNQSGMSSRQWTEAKDFGLIFLLTAALGGSAYRLATPTEDTVDSHRLTTAQCSAPSPELPLIALYLLADTQFHELRGERSAAQMPMVDAVVPVALRPVALDLLSGVTFDHFAELFRMYASLHPKTQLHWAHLGDLGDIGCSTELERYPSYFRAFEDQGKPQGQGLLAGIASGNHDNTFEGNFAWHPDWDPACRVHTGAEAGSGHRLDKPSADAEIRSLAKSFGDNTLWLPNSPLSHLAAWVEGRNPLPMVSRLGELPADSGTPARPVYAVFLDSGDSALSTVGAAGIMGHINQVQLDAAMAVLPEQAYVVVLLHHPLAALGRFAQQRLANFAKTLGSRLLLVVSAHTHQSTFTLYSPLDDVQLPEFTVGSTTDPTQEAAILEIAGTAHAPRVHVVTQAAVARAGMDCGLPSNLDANECDALLSNLAQQCPMVHKDEWQLRMHKPEEMTGYQRQLADELAQCLGLPAMSDALDPENYTAFSRADPILHRQLVCVSWAASLLQGNKRSGWRYVDALRTLQEKAPGRGGIAVDVPLGGAVLRASAVESPAQASRAVN